MPEVGKSLISITPDSTGGSGGTTPFEVNNVLKGSISNGVTIDVNLEDQNGSPYTPQTSALVGNTLTVTIDNETPIEVNNAPQGDITNGSTIEVNLEDQNGAPYTPQASTLAGNTLTVTIDNETPIEVNNAPQGDITNGSTIEVDLEDSLGNPVVPTSVVKVGNTLTIEVPTGPAPSGVLLQWPNPDQITSFRTGDVGWRAQNGWYNYTPPTNPAKIAQMNLTAGANTWWILKNPLTVNGVSSTVRFVDVDGVQVFSATSNKNAVVIDKLTGLMWSRRPRVAGGADKLWATAIDNCLAYSITVKGILYDDWFLPSLQEHLVSPIQLNIPMIQVIDQATGVTIIEAGVPDLQFIWTSTTRTGDPSRAYSLQRNPSTTDFRFDTKTVDLLGHFLVRDARNLIS